MSADPIVRARPGDASEVMSFLQEHLGLRFEKSRADHVLAAVQDIVGRAGAHDAAGYIAHVRRDPEALDELIAAATVGETYFFRHPDQLAEIAHTVLPELRTRRGARPRVWSAGCATGEEAYTLAMILEDAGMPDAPVLATDLSRPALRVAEIGSYRPWSVRGRPEALARLDVDGSRYRVPERLRRRVQFRRLNLVVDDYPVGCDLIVCRNVLLYFTPEHVAAVGRKMAQALAPGGWIVTAATDPLLGSEQLLRRVSTPAGLMYRRRGPEDEDPPRPVVNERRIRPARPPRSRRAADGRRRALASSTTTPPAVSAGPSPAPHRHEHDEVVAIRRLGDSGQTQAAEAKAAEAVEQFAVDPELRCVYAEVLLALDKADLAAAQAAAAVYLDPAAAVAYVTLGRAELARGHTRAAARAFRCGLGLLEAAAGDEVVPYGGGVTATELAGYADTFLAVAAGPEGPG